MINTIQDFINAVRLTFDNHSDIIFIKDTSSTFVYTNKTYNDYNNFLEQPIIGKNDIQLFDEDRAKRNMERDRRVLDSGKAIEYELEIINSPYAYEDNFILLNKTPIRNDSGEIIGVLGMGKKLLELVETKKMLENQLRLIDGLFNSIPYPVFLKDTRGVYQKVNQAFLDDLQKTQDEILGKTDTEILGEKAGRFYEKKDQKVLDTGIRDIYISQSTSSKKRFLTIKDPIHNHLGETVGVLGIVNRYYELDELQEDLLQVQKINSIAQLAGGISHDLNNILTSISGLSSLLLLEKDIDNNYKKQLQVIYDASMKAAALIEKLQAFASRGLLEEQEIQVNDFINDVMELIISNYGVNVKFDMQFCKKSTTIYGDATQLQQLILNLVTNAVEAMNSDGKISVITDVVTLKEHDDYLIKSNLVGAENYVLITIKDQGPGIDYNQMSHIFEPYYSTKNKGTGMGLAIVYGVITSHNGLLQLDTGDDGTEFRIYLPMKKAFFT